MRPFTMENIWYIWSRRSKRSIDRFDRLWWVRLILYRGEDRNVTPGFYGVSHRAFRVSVEVWTSEMSWTFACPAIGILRPTIPILDADSTSRNTPDFMVKTPQWSHFPEFWDGWLVDFMRFFFPKFHDAIESESIHWFLRGLTPMDFPYFSHGFSARWWACTLETPVLPEQTALAPSWSWVNVWDTWGLPVVSGFLKWDPEKHGKDSGRISL